MIKSRPKCINHGCDFPAKSKNNNSGWRIHCWHCQQASYGAVKHREGVTPFKTGVCSNIDARLGFMCPVDYSYPESIGFGITEVDHKDGNHCNDDPSNLQELCPLCHKMKGRLSGDFQGGRYR